MQTEKELMESLAKAAGMSVISVDAEDLKKLSELMDWMVTTKHIIAVAANHIVAHLDIFADMVDTNTLTPADEHMVSALIVNGRLGGILATLREAESMLVEVVFKPAAIAHAKELLAAKQNGEH